MMIEKKIAQFALRMDASLKENLSEKAWENRRSLNAELCDRLKKSLEAEQEAA